MRYLAYAMLATGFFWICIEQVRSRDTFREVYWEIHHQKLDNQQTFKREEVEDLLKDTIRAYEHQVAPFYVGAFLMLGGGIVLDFILRRKEHAKA